MKWGDKSKTKHETLSEMTHTQDKKKKKRKTKLSSKEKAWKLTCENEKGGSFRRKSIPVSSKTLLYSWS